MPFSPNREDNLCVQRKAGDGKPEHKTVCLNRMPALPLASPPHELLKSTNVQTPEAPETPRSGERVPPNQVTVPPKRKRPEPAHTILRRSHATELAAPAATAGAAAVAGDFAAPPCDPEASNDCLTILTKYSCQRESFVSSG